METVSTILRRTALGLTALFAVGGLLFALGYAFEDPGGSAAVLLAVAIFLPMGTLTLLAARRPHLSLRVLTVALVLYAVWGVVGLFVHLVQAPDMPVIALVLALPIAVAGLRYAVRAGCLLLGVAAVPFALVLVRMARESSPEGGPGMGVLLGGSTGVVVVPLVLLACLFLLAGGLDHSAQGPGRDPGEPEPEPQPPPRTVQPQ